MSTKKIVSGTVYYGIIPKLTIFINVLILPIITPYLTTDDYGIQGIIYSYTSVFLAIAPLGLHVHLVNSFYEFGEKYNLVWGRILYLLLALGLFLGILTDYSKKYVYYPLHYEPEASTLVCAVKYEKQLFFIDSWAKSLPADTVLYVKEHYAVLGHRELTLYKELKKYPNVVMIDPWESSRKLIKMQLL